MNDSFTSSSKRNANVSLLYLGFPFLHSFRLKLNKIQRNVTSRSVSSGVLFSIHCFHTSFSSTQTLSWNASSQPPKRGGRSISSFLHDQAHLWPTCRYCAVSCSMRSITTTGVLSRGPRGLKPREPSGPLGWRVTVTWC